MCRLMGDHMRRVVTVLRVFTLLTALALVASACGGSDAGEDASDVAEPVAATSAPEPEPTEAIEPTEVPEPEPEPTDAPEPEPEPTEVPAASAGAVSSCDAELAPGATAHTLQSEGRDREYTLFVPSSYVPDEPLPLVMNWHGLGSNGPEQMAFSDYGILAEREGFLVVAATGVPSPGDDSNSWELEPEQDGTRDDLLFANELLDAVIEQACVDQTRVYTTGMSNGGYFSSVLVCEMADRIAAAASVAALTHADDCEPSRQVPYIGFHGVDDTTVPYDGDGESSLAPGQYVELFDRSILAEFEEFAAAWGCSTEPTTESIGDDVTAYSYDGCVEMTFYEIADAGHTWPGSSVSLAISEAVGLGVTTDDINATEVSWEFFTRHALEP